MMNYLIILFVSVAFACNKHYECSTCIQNFCEYEIHINGTGFCSKKASKSITVYNVATSKLHCLFVIEVQSVLQAEAERKTVPKNSNTVAPPNSIELPVSESKPHVSKRTEQKKAAETAERNQHTNNNTTSSFGQPSIQIGTDPEKSIKVLLTSTVAPRSEEYSTFKVSSLPTPNINEAVIGNIKSDTNATLIASNKTKNLMYPDTERSPTNYQQINRQELPNHHHLPITSDKIQSFSKLNDKKSNNSGSDQIAYKLKHIRTYKNNITVTSDSSLQMSNTSKCQMPIKMEPTKERAKISKVQQEILMSGDCNSFSHSSLFSKLSTLFTCSKKSESGIEKYARSLCALEKFKRKYASQIPEKEMAYLSLNSAGLFSFTCKALDWRNKFCIHSENKRQRQVWWTSKKPNNSVIFNQVLDRNCTVNKIEAKKPYFKLARLLCRSERSAATVDMSQLDSSDFGFYLMSPARSNFDKCVLLNEIKNKCEKKHFF